MTEFTSIQEAMAKGTGPVKIRGWCYRERGSNQVRFIVIRDSSNIVQCVMKPDNSCWQEAQKVKIETSMEIEGDIKPDKRAPTGYEVAVKNLKIIGPCEIYPITKDQSPEFLLDQRHLWIRSRRLTSIMKIRSTVTESIHKFFRDMGFYEFNAPVLQPSQCEGGSTLFEVKYYKDKMYLSQSWQLYAEAAVFSLEKIYNIGPTFRAEKSKTSRHLSEFWMAEMEAAWMNLNDVAKIAQEEVYYILQQV